MSDKKLSDEDLFEKLVNGEDITEEIETHQGTFTIKFPLGTDFIKISRRKAEMRGDIPPERFNKAEDIDFEAYAALDVVVLKGPDWWEKLKSSTQCPDQKIVTTLYRGYLRHYAAIQQKISPHGRSDGDGKVQDDDEVVGDGPFSAVTYGSEDQKVGG